MNVYTGKNFWEACTLLISRLWHLLRGDPLSLASDELQLLVLMGVAASAGLVGCFLVLRKMAMLANSLSHTILIGIILSFLLLLCFGGLNEEGGWHLSLGVLIISALVTSMATTFLTHYLSQTFRLYEDASNGFVFSFLFALGVLLATLFTRNSHVGTELIIGNVDALHPSDLTLVAVVLLINILLNTLFYRLYWVSTFDKTFSATLGVPTTGLSYLLMTQVSATTISGFRAVGVLMVLAFIVVPPLTARLWTNRLRTMLFLSVAIGCLASLLGVFYSRHLLTVSYTSLSTSGLVVCVMFLLFIFSLLFSPSKGIISLSLRRVKLKRKLFKSPVSDH